MSNPQTMTTEELVERIDAWCSEAIGMAIYGPILDELAIRAHGFEQAVMRADEAEEALRRERGLE